jgi:anti-anti-sigma factor
MPAPLRPQIVEVDGVTVVVFGPGFERIDEGLIPVISEVFSQLAAQQRRPLVVDLSLTKFFGSSFIEQLFRLWNRAKDAKGRGFALVGVDDYCREILSVTNLHQLWPMYTTRAQAVESVKSSGSSS